MADKKADVKINLRGTVGVRGQYYGPGDGVTVPYDVAESIALSQGKSVAELQSEAKETPKEAAPTEKPKTTGGADDLESLTVAELKDRARDAEIEGFSTMRKEELIDALSK